MPRGALRSVMRGSGSYGPAQKVRRETGEAVLGFWPRLEDFPDYASIDPTGTRRRARALGVLGWTQATMAQRIGRPEAAFKASLRGERVSARFARTIKRTYDELWDQRPEDHGVPVWVAERARRRAQADGWYGPLAWDDDTIDDPAAVPQTDAPPPSYTEGENVVDRFLMGESVVLDKTGQRGVIAHLMEWTQNTPEEIGARLDMTGESVSRTWERIKRKARDEGRKAPWRRVYVPLRDMDLTRDELRSAA